MCRGMCNRCQGSKNNFVTRVIPYYKMSTLSLLLSAHNTRYLCLWTSRIRDSKFKSLPTVYDHCVVTSAWMHIIFHILVDKNTGLITDLKSGNLTFSYIADSGFRLTLEIWNVAHWFWTLNHDRWTQNHGEALIISIPKPGKDHFNPLNHRPIALTSCICKTVERMVNERLVWYLEKNGSLAKQQCGYRANRSTVDHLIRLETFIRDAFIQNQHLVAVFFDL